MMSIKKFFNSTKLISHKDIFQGSTAVWSGNVSYSYLLLLLFFSHLHFMSSFKDMSFQKFVKDEEETSWLKCNSYDLCFGGSQF